MQTVIAGAGPTGLLLAGDLAAAGVEVTVLERRAGESNLTRAFAVHARTLEQLDARGLADEVIATGTRVTRLRLFGHVSVDLGALPSRYDYVLITPQYNVERILEERAVKAGARIVRGTAVTGLRQDERGVTVDTDQGSYAADYLVGADGARSGVRQALGLGFPGRGAVRSLMLADVRMAEPPADAITVNAVGAAFAFIAPFGDGWYRVFAWNRGHQVSDDTPLELDEVRDTVRAAFGTDFGMGECRWLSRFHSDERQVERYRTGRVFLAGDAAHVHSPAGGQGMNTGLQDAANLGWKLAAAAAGWAPAGLLDTYHAERHAVGKLVLRTSGGLIRLALLQSRAARLGRDALANLALHLPPAQRALTGTVSGIGIDYPHAPRQADVETGSGRLYELLRTGRFALLAPQAPRGYEDRLVHARHDRCILVRPDGYRAWTGTEGDVAVALRTHLGDPR
ncbi:FAD-dependent monooxygenase [Dactylosporangium matsuzakiense]|uniref:FAD-dependent oxidoreductase n=1 Tax=Dactylosporangium matsuzakiense TaxID=53360 RepID=A0A9W6KG34_9ACTN|nr:FAD-dependent monooxygenase [Dactylosporangium matsuzakiense]UWZ46098.1 FAD-dependent monooxygenase [Dactylosporangium matsuzakiense]GLL00232.1 FAD-dependent oxidoreductase [Dactylosporangium matsuzakiense]